MSNTTYIGKKMRSFKSSPQFDGFSKVVIVVSDEIEYSAGTDLGRTLRLTCPWGTPQMAQNILADVRGFRYQPYIAENALIDPAAELGDGITANNVYGGIYTQKIRFGPLLTATVAAPEDEELNHEYPYKSKPNREITRETRLLRASLIVQENKIAAEITDRQNADRELYAALSVQADRITAEVKDRQSDVKTLNARLDIQAGQIEARVTKTGGNPSSFGWTLTDSDWTIKANNQNILRATKSGLEVYGKVTATSGKIGGFDINTNYLSYNNQAWGGTNSTGIYIGISGIQLGKYFKVDSAGNLTARSGRFEGTVYAGNIQYGETGGYFSGSGISSGSIYGNRLVGGTITTDYTSEGINGSLGRADAAYNICTGVSSATKFIAQEVQGTSKGSFKKLYINGSSVTKKSATFTDGDGATVIISYWG